LISDPLEQNLPESKVKINVTITDGNDNQQLTLGDKTTAQNYHQQAISLLQKRYELLVQSGARVIQINAAETLASQLKSGEA
jgi:hypothetical protein